MRLRRKRRILRCLKRRRELKPVSNNTQAIRRDDILLMSVVRNEKIRLPFFLEYYRKLGINHFLFVDNNSDDGSFEFLKEQADVSVWRTTTSYKRASYGLDWSNYLLRKYAHDHWVLSVDPDEFFIYPFCDTRPIRALTDWLDGSAVRSFGTMLIDMYPEGPVDADPYAEGQNPFEIARWFDPGNYMITKNPEYKNLWIQGGPRARVFFQDNPSKAPALNKIPLVKWNRRYVYVSSTHSLLPRGLNQVYDEWGGEKASGSLLHAKLINTLGEKAREELQRGQHYRGSGEYKAYATRLEDKPVFWCEWSEAYINWRQLEILGLMSKGNWA
ncbi:MULTISPECIES: glycosyltransferase family 2 protein [unclassified Ruegeria]|uniref:glycosyltransferase family 2 protein n=1 Tax=unclassified Ruegeria TaxID=2625375 RepID=UPI00149098AC|nr:MULTISPECIES: glycosyltransferase family 2 protein [unclassified Ruegeria]NOC45812.1 glycosyltransferase family 2 protein [Ruegeria sp. HKCCD7559]NOD84667.1 glycosyltransferase family 2 protein [Ruegeria sp. HKCCD6119]